MVINKVLVLFNSVVSEVYLLNFIFFSEALESKIKAKIFVNSLIRTVDSDAYPKLYVQYEA